MATRMIHSRDGSMMGTYFVAIVQYQASMLGGNVAGSAHYYCCQLSFCWLVACQSCGPLQLHWGMWMSSSWGESKKCFEAQDGWLFFWGAYGTRSIRRHHTWRSMRLCDPSDSFKYSSFNIYSTGGGEFLLVSTVLCRISVWSMTMENRHGLQHFANGVIINAISLFV